MIKSIVNLRQYGPDEITFDVIADDDGVNELVSMVLNGQRFSVFVQAEPCQVTTYSIPTDAVGTHQVVIYAERSGISSDSIIAYFAEPGPKDQRCQKCGHPKKYCVCKPGS
jgi:hypothetical protein